MTGLAAFVACALVVAATAALTLAVVALVRIPESHVKVHAMSMGVVLGPVLILVAALPAGGDMMLRALLVGAFLLVTAAVSVHAILRLITRAGDRKD